MEMRNLNHSKRGRSGDFIVLTQAAGAVEPRERAFNNSSPGQDFPFVRLAFFGNFHAHEQSSVRFMNECSATAVVGAKFRDGWPALARFHRRVNAGDSAMDVGGVNDNAKNISHRIGYDMALSSFRFFPRQSPASRPNRRFLRFASQ